MLHGKTRYVLLLGALVLTAGLIGQALSQDSRPARQPFDPAAFQKQMDQMMKDRLGITDDEEWKVLQPKIEAVQTLSRQTRGNMGMMFGPGMGGGRPGRPGQPGDATNPPPAQNEVDKTSAELTKVLANKDAKAEDIKAALTAYRAARDKAKENLAKAQKELRDLVTARQEAVLVTMGVLD